MITLQGLVAITTIQQRERTTVVTDDGALAPALTLTGLISKRSHSTLALARVAERQLHELAHWSRVAGGVHVDSSEMDVDDGQYELRNVQTRVTPESGVSIGIVVSLTLVRLGGAGPGGNIVRRILPQATLVSNGFAVTSLPRFAQPVGATEQTGAGIQNLTSADGIELIYNATTGLTYVLPGADYNAGEVKVWDTGGSSTASDWVRVFGPDHVFASPAHCAIDNGLVRLIPLTTAGLHRIDVYNGTGWSTLTTTTGDYAYMGAAGHLAWVNCRLIDVSPWRVEVQWTMTRSATPFFPTKTYVLTRGQPLAKLTMTADTAAEMWAGFEWSGWKYTFVQQTLPAAVGRIRDHTLEASLVDLASGADIGQPLFASVAPAGTVMALMAGPTLTSRRWYKLGTGGMIIDTSISVTSLTVWLGGIAYDATKLWGEAEAGAGGGAAGTATVAGASGGGSNNCITLPNLNDYVENANLQNPPVGTSVIAFARVQNSGVSGSDTLQLTIRNATTAGNLTGGPQSWTAATLGTAGTWKWISVVGTNWNGTDLIHPRVTRSTTGGGGAFYVDQFVLVTVANGAYRFAQDVARGALTDMRVWAQSIRQVR